MPEQATPEASAPPLQRTPAKVMMGLFGPVIVLAGAWLAWWGWRMLEAVNTLDCGGLGGLGCAGGAGMAFVSMALGALLLLSGGVVAAVGWKEPRRQPR